MKTIKMYAAEAEGATGTTTATAAQPATFVPQSDKLTDLRAQYTAKWQELMKLTDPFAPETKEAKLAAWKIEGEIKAEEAALLKAHNDEKIAEARNQRLALNQNQLDAYAALLTVQANKKATPEELVAAQTAFDTAKELVDNELLAKYATSRPATKAPTDGAASTSKGEEAAAIVALHLEGKTNKEIEALGYARSTVWHAIDKYKKANA